jgi:hypothetical protein
MSLVLASWIFQKLWIRRHEAIRHTRLQTKNSLLEVLMSGKAAFRKSANTTSMFLAFVSGARGEV